ncbi:ShlB/FhaC/HecB family hemolysin secretion/activation protein [Pseudomonas alkylphenolica]|uniref:ShlB/FhaC/HecB family hemolysin secretion/activation protein n=1 Tax=Pseudomonas alkylphenolica TaxID=237609 RepID=UPI0018D73287|nr:ShlB/FhaC/HecB family hemolysin secretion/activation protein [Pseudomonas alkylphenolica]MBH3427528.1 ShlB/FhaC/HecB family hemolysin secretion/activation protein [Pseudomonas alkylphenolica]
MRSLAVAILGLSWASVPSAEPLPSYLNSNETERSLPAPNLPIDAYRPLLPVLQLPTLAVPSQALPANTRIKVRKVRFEGGSLYALSDLRDNYQGLIDRDVTLAELTEATERLTRRYQQDDYVLSYAYLPPQDFADGRVQVVLVEGYIRDVELHGDVGPAANYLKQLASKLKAERPVMRKTLERYTTLMSRVPGVSLQAEVTSAGTSDGATTMIVHASRQPFAATLDLADSNRESLQALLGASSNAQTSLAEQVSFSALFPPGNEHEHYYRLDYSQYLDSEGSQLNLSATQLRSDPNARLRLNNGIDLRQHRDLDRYSIGLSQTLTASSHEWLSVAGRFYTVNDDTDYEGVDVPLRYNSRTDLRALGFEGDWRTSTARQLRILSVGAYQGLDYLGAKTDSEIDLDFLRVRVAGVQSDGFFDHWQGVASAALYWSNDSLPDSERAVFGGQNFGRGYPGDQASGDKGWGAAYELNYSIQGTGELLKLVQPYGVVDAARSWFNQLDVRDSRLSSVALGVRLGDARNYSLSLEAAKPMSDIALDSFDRRPRYTLSFRYSL